MTACHAPQHPRGGEPAAYTITLRTPPLVGRHAGPGLTLSEAVCAPCLPQWAGQIEASGGEVVGLKALAVPTQARPAPVGLDAIDPTPAASEPFSPAEAFHPGDYVLEEINERGWGPHEAAANLNWAPELLALVVEGEQDIKAGMAADLARTFETSEAFWLNLQTIYTSWREHQPASPAEPEPTRISVNHRRRRRRVRAAVGG